MRNRHAAPLRRFLADLDDHEADRFIDQLTTLIAHLRDEPPPEANTAADEPRRETTEPAQ
jgi:hypothetical protein